MSETNKTIIIIFLGFVALINLTMAFWAFTRRSADDLVKIEKAHWDIVKEKLGKEAQDCKESGGIVEYYSESINCKKPN